MHKNPAKFKPLFVVSARVNANVYYLSNNLTQGFHFLTFVFPGTVCAMQVHLSATVFGYCWRAISNCFCWFWLQTALSLSRAITLPSPSTTSVVLSFPALTAGLASAWLAGLSVLFLAAILLLDALWWCWTVLLPKLKRSSAWFKQSSLTTAFFLFITNVLKSLSPTTKFTKKYQIFWNQEPVVKKWDSAIHQINSCYYNQARWQSSCE